MLNLVQNSPAQANGLLANSLFDPSVILKNIALEGGSLPQQQELQTLLSSTQNTTIPTNNNVLLLMVKVMDKMVDTLSLVVERLSNMLPGALDGTVSGTGGTTGSGKTEGNGGSTKTPSKKPTKKPDESSLSSWLSSIASVGTIIAGLAKGGPALLKKLPKSLTDAATKLGEFLPDWLKPSKLLTKAKNFLAKVF